MNFKNDRFITKGVDLAVSPLLQLFMWHLIDAMPPPKDYLQVFKSAIENGQQKITHIQEEPAYIREYLLRTDSPFFVGKIYVIDNGQYSTMLLAEEY